MADEKKIASYKEIFSYLRWKLEELYRSDNKINLDRRGTLFIDNLTIEELKQKIISKNRNGSVLTHFEKTGSDNQIRVYHHRSIS